MTRPTFRLKPTHKAVTDYYAQLQNFDQHNASHEGAVRSAMQNLIDFTARKNSLSLIPEFSTKAKRGKKIRIDGVIQDDFGLNKGSWEAKDVDDNIDDAVKAKIQAGYPLSNIIFENTRTGVLYQAGAEVQRFDLTDRDQLASLINTFFDYREPEHVDFEKAVDDFKDKVADIALRLNSTIKQAHKDNKPFQIAFNSLFEICRESLNKNIRKDAIDEMIIQHLLTERLISNIFQNSDFKNRNIIASEVEKVITALIGESYSREIYLSGLDRFYRAIEAAALAEPDFDRRLVILNNVYEKFFQGYSVKVADTHGIVYTPPEIVDFMCKSVVEALKREFGKSLGDEDVVVLDPCTGTGSFVVKMLELAEGRYLEDFYKKRLFANEVMLMPYYIASLTIEHKYFERAGKYESFDGICFVDTLDLKKGEQREIFVNKGNKDRVEKEKNADVTVIIANPPYNVGQQNENDENKNRKYDLVDGRVKETYVKDSQATSTSKLYDAYVKFFRWACDRLETEDGIICFVSNNKFLDGIAFDGMRSRLFKEFSAIYHLDLKGNVKKDPKLSGTMYNVFGIQVGVGITLLIKSKTKITKELYLYQIEKNRLRHDKLNWMSGQDNYSVVKYSRIKPDSRHSWILPKNSDLFDRMIHIGFKKGKNKDVEKTHKIFINYCLGVNTARDAAAYNFNDETLKQNIQTQINAYKAEVDRYATAGNNGDVDSFVDYSVIKWSRDLKQDLRRGRKTEFSDEKIRRSLYRPFTKEYLFFDRVMNEEVYQFPTYFPTPATEQENRVIMCSSIATEKPFYTMMTNIIPNLAFVGFGSPCQNFPFYVYNEDGGDRRENISDWALATFRDHYGNAGIGKWDIFYYIYAVLHHPTYRTLFGECLKRDLPRIPFVEDFRDFADAGRSLAELHLNYEQLKPYPLDWLENKDTPIDWRVDKMRLTKDKRSLVYNDWLTLGNIPAAAFDYRLGNRSALDWIIDQYRVKRDAEGVVISDPNRPDDERYIVDLVGRIIALSLETQRVIGGLPPLEIEAG